jgi:hypothetical protein
MSAPTAADEAKYAAFMRAVLHFSNDRTAERLTAAAGVLSGVEAYVVAMLAVMWDDMSAIEAERDALRARAEAAEAALATARAEGAAAERAAVVAWLRRTAVDISPIGIPDGELTCITDDIEEGRHVRPVEDA